MNDCTPTEVVYGVAERCLPNTGAELWVLVAVATGLILLAVALRRAGR